MIYNLFYSTCQELMELQILLYVTYKLLRKV